MSKLRRFYLDLIYRLGHWFGRAQQWIRQRSPLPRKIRKGAFRRTQSGFILPTTSLLLVVVALTITAVSLRSLNRVENVAGDRQQKIIYNAATPAIDRAKSKLEKLFASDPRRTPTGVPPEEYLLSLMLNDNDLVPDLDGNPYTLPGETRLDINGDGTNDNAWQYEADTNGDDVDDSVIAYSITFKTPKPTGGTFDAATLFNQSPAALKDRADNLEVRSGPLQSDNTADGCNLIERLGEDFLPPLESGWFQDASTTANLRKNFQIDAVVVPKVQSGEFETSGGLNTIATLELQQDKLAARGNRWAAWFRNDLELFPGPDFNWNGAMHTEGSIFFVANSSRLTLYLVSSPASCLYSLDASQISASGEGSLAGSAPKNYNGDFVASSLTNRFGNFRREGFASIHYQQDTENTSRGAPVITSNNFSAETDSINTTSAISIAMDPLPLFTEDLSIRRDPGNFRSGEWAEQAYVQAGRAQNDSLRKPYLDDFFRADNRYGPRASYGGGSEETTALPAGTVVGTPINGAAELTRNSNPASNADLGLDGYWERRAIQEGLRLIVGQRLELGSDSLNPLGYPQNAADFDAGRPHAALQRRSLRDVLAAVQGSLVYHHNYENGAEPVAAMATVTHPGSPGSLKNAQTFEQPPEPFAVRDNAGLRSLFGEEFGNNGDELLTDFFEGRGTNGWEFDAGTLNSMMPASTGASTATVQFSNTALRDAVENLAALSGDPDGAFPAVQESGTVHPYPELTKWGNFSELNRSLSDSLNSPADQSNQQTAGLTMGMLAYNLSYLDALDYGNANTQTILENLADELGAVGDKTSNFDSSLPDINDGTQGDPNLPDSDVAAWSLDAAAPVGVRTDFLNARGDEFDKGKVDLFRNDKQSDRPFSARVYPAKTSVTGGSADALAVSASDVSKYVEVQLADAQLTPEPSPPFAEAGRWQDESPRVPPDAYVFALGDANGNPNENGVDPTDFQRWARLIALKEQVWRDRNFGFAPTFGRAVNTSGANPNLHQFSYKIEYVYPSNPGDTFTNFSGVGEDLNDNGVLDPDEDVNFNGRLDVQNETGFDYNGNGTTDDTHEFDGDGSGVIDNGEDSNGNNQFDRTAWYAFGGRTFYQGEYYEFGCDFSQSTGNDYFGFGLPTDFASERRFLHLATTLCPVEAKYPSLYYLFPTETHDFKGDRVATQAVTLSAGPDPSVDTVTEDVEVTYTQPRTGLDEDYIDTFLTDTEVSGIIGGTQFAAVDPAAIAIKPLPLGDWRIPVDRDVTPPGDCGNSAPVCSELSLIAVQGTGGAPVAYHHPGIIDAAFFSGRDLLVSRALDLDVDMLRDGGNSPGEISPDTWIPFGDIEDRLDGGIVYGFREDSLREDGIARPASTTWNTYQGNPEQTTNRMLVNSFPGKDPPINDATGISPKPVDYYPDPDRRAHGFRLRNAETVRRVGGGDEDENLYGLSFVSDNALYIKGDLNFHRSGGGTVEEFQNTLADDYSNFYTRNSLNSEFANPSQDDWRPVELLADIVTPLSNNFCEGSVQDSLRSVGFDIGDLYGCSTSDGNTIYTSFTNTDRPTTLAEPSEWWHENRFDVMSPPAVDFAGRILRKTNGVASQYPTSDFEIPRTGGGNATAVRAEIPVASETTTNAVFVSGIGPSRFNQSYGGLHNFLPLLENWGDTPLRIAGAFLQLSFRTSSTGPYDTDAWETTQEVQRREFLTYYGAPQRRWGYDVGLQYAPAGPIASRFVTLGDTRSEFYGEPAADDPYICLLRKSIADHDTDDCD
ncbi:MAG: hormogonium polysaccharide biosynthesis protein HpsA [Cyanobacteria bacterium P01_C01_bin.89]